MDVVSNQNPSLSARHCGLSRHGVPKPSPFFTCFVCTWNMICQMEVKRRDTMRARCRPSTALWRLLLHFLTLPVPILALCSRVMGQRYGCIPVRVCDREGEWVHWGPWRDSHALSLIQVARLSFYHLLCLSCFLSGIGHFVIGQWLGMTPLSGFCICWKLRFNWFNLI